MGFVKTGWRLGFLHQGVHVPAEPHPKLIARIEEHVHFGNNLKKGTYEDIGLDECVNSNDKLGKWLSMIAREAMDMNRLPGIQHAGITPERVNECWASGWISAGDVGRL